MFFLIAVLEIIFSLGFFPSSSLQSIPLPEEFCGLFEVDEDLFWKMKPNLKVVYKDTIVQTNEMGLRSETVLLKNENEFRILSLGESSTFGARVEANETYSHKLEGYLNERNDGWSYKVINAGVSCYSSFQSLMFLKLKKDLLKPDLVLFYHELNDYLPSSVRDSSNNEIGTVLTDKMLYESHHLKWDRWLMVHSSLYRAIKQKVALKKIFQFRRRSLDNPLLKIGLPDTGLSSRLRKMENDRLIRLDINEKKFPQRVSEPERIVILDELFDYCKKNGIRLIMVHPSYLKSKPHECVLTDFCKRRGVFMIETFDVLHPKGTLLFADAWHPNRDGHEQLARHMFQYFEKINIPERK